MSAQTRHATRLDLASFLVWPRGVARLGVVLSVALALGYGAFYFVEALDRLGEQARSNAALSFDDREVAGGNAIVAVNASMFEARALIPEDDAYRVVAGPNVAGATDLTEEYVDQYARYFLMPRRPAPDARWILCFGCNLAELGEGFEARWEDSGIVIGRRAA